MMINQARTVSMLLGSISGLVLATIVMATTAHAAKVGSYGCMRQDGDPGGDPAGCSICVPNECYYTVNVLVEHVGRSTGSETVQKCVEYDHTPPAHCAGVTQTDYEVVRNSDNSVVGSCYFTDCDNGSPTSVTCVNPWIRP